MKLIIAGSRYCDSIQDVIHAVRVSKINVAEIEEVVSGGARGIDRCGELWAMAKEIPVKRFEADWKRHGKSAGPIRNREMAEYVGVEGWLIAIPHPTLESRGTRNMIKVAREVGLKGVFVYEG